MVTPEELARLRETMRKRKGGMRDPHEYRFPQVKPGEPSVKLKVRVLPPTPEMSSVTDGLWYYQNGAHYIDRKRSECPRVHDEEPCPVCALGFELLKEEEDKKQRSMISKRYLSRGQNAINVWFLPDAGNPEDVAGKVKWINVGKQLFDILEEAFMRDDDGGDPDDPRAYGDFTDIDNGYTLMIEIKNQGEYNNYESSRFLPKTKGPLHKSKKVAEHVLAQRHNLVEKFEPRNHAALARIVKNLLAGDGSGDGDDGGFDTTVEETKEAKKETKKEPKKAAKKSVKKESEPEQEQEPKSELEKPEESESEADPVEDEDDEELQRLIQQIQASD